MLRSLLLVSLAAALALLSGCATNREPDPLWVEAEVSAIVTDLLGHSHPIDMIEVEGNGRTSYFGSFDVDGREQLRFDLSVRPPGEEAHTIEFQRRFFTGAVGRR